MPRSSRSVVTRSASPDIRKETRHSPVFHRTSPLRVLQLEILRAIPVVHSAVPPIFPSFSHKIAGHPRPRRTVCTSRGMTTAAVTPVAANVIRPFRRYLTDAGPQENLWTISLRVDIEANTHRLFEAFTRPEYLETWLRFPHDDASARMVGWQEGDGFRLDHYLCGQRDTILRCRFLTSRRRKLLFTWSVTGEEPPGFRARCGR